MFPADHCVWRPIGAPAGKSQEGCAFRRRLPAARPRPGRPPIAPIPREEFPVASSRKDAAGRLPAESRRATSKPIVGLRKTVHRNSYAEDAAQLNLIG